MSITDYAQKALGDVVFVELPSVGAEIAKGGPSIPSRVHPIFLNPARTDLIGAVESVKAASDIVSWTSMHARCARLRSHSFTQYAPMSGKVLEVNQRLNDEPGLLNKSPEGEGVHPLHNPPFNTALTHKTQAGCARSM